MTTLDKLPIAFETQSKSSTIPPLFKNASSPPEDAIKFDWENKWLKGEEYAHILNNINVYCKTYGLSKLGTKTHPPSIYTEPQSRISLPSTECNLIDGMVYFVEGNSVGSDFGFPRVDTKKHYRWYPFPNAFSSNILRKKMNFTTDLPKKRPYVTYIVASAVKCERFFPNSKDEGPSYRMHAVILNKERVHTQKYKSKASPTSKAHNNDLDENSQSLSSTCSSAESTEHEKGDSHLEDFPSEIKRSASTGEKNYILCHIRKIDSNYKTSRAGGKKGSFSKEDEEEAEEEEDEEEVEEPLNKKIFSGPESTTIVQQEKPKSPVLEISKESPPKVKTAFKIVSSELLTQLNSRSEAGSPLELTRGTLTSSPGLQQKSGLFGLGSKNSAFSRLQNSSLTPKLSPTLAASKSPKSEEEEISVKSEPEAPRQVPQFRQPVCQKPLFEKFHVANSATFDYLQFFASLLNVKR